ncbi:MAG TPA: SCO family protein [Dissulfurispiraceae bacterium]
MKAKFPLLVALTVLLVQAAFIPPAPGKPFSEAGLDEKTGNTISPGLVLYDENGKSIRFAELSGRPLILTFVYYRCSHICPQMLEGLARALADLQLEPGKDYSVITLSFDDTDSPADARDQKRNYLKAVSKPYPEKAWRFLTGSRESIEKLLETTGIRVKRGTHGFVHPEVLVFVSPSGRITRYLYVEKFHYGGSYPVTFSPTVLTSAINEASREKLGISEGRSALYCFSHEPAMQEKFFNILKVSGAVTLICSIALFLYLQKGRN